MKNIIIFSLLLTMVLSNAKAQSGEAPYKLKKVVETYFSHAKPGLTAALLAEAYKNDLRVAIVWPCLINGEFLDDDIIGLLYQLKDGEWMFQKSIDLSKGHAEEELASTLGAKDYTILKSDGVSLETIPHFVHTKSVAIQKALSQNQDDEAVKEIESLSRAFTIKMCGYDDVFSGFVIGGMFAGKPMKFAELKTEGESASAAVTIELEGTSQTGKMSFIKSGSGWAIDSLQ